MRKHIRLSACLCMAALCLGLAACAAAPSTEPEPVTDSTTQAPRTTAPLAEAAVSPADSGFVGTWTAAANPNNILSITFYEDGSATLKHQSGSLGGSFTVTGEDTVLLIFGGKPSNAEYTVDGDSLTLKSDTFDLHLTKSL